MKSKIAIVFFVIILAACSSCPSATPNKSQANEPSLTHINTPLPLSTNTSVPSPTPTPILTGEGQLLVAFYASGSCGSCIIIGDFFTGEILHTIPLSTFQIGKLFWSPDGNHILYTDTTSRINVLLFNLETGQSKQLGDYPAPPEVVNYLEYVTWSYDSEYVMFDTHLQDGKSYYASKDGVLSSYERRYTTWFLGKRYNSGLNAWFPDNRTIFSVYGEKESYNIETKSFTPLSTNTLNKLNASHVLKNFILLEREETKVSAIPFPENWNDHVAWQYDSLLSQIFTLAELSQEMTPRQINIDIVQQINYNQIALIGSVYNTKEESYFVKLVDFQNLPAVISLDDTFQSTTDRPLLVSPDGNYYVKAYCAFLENCPNYDPNWKNRITIWGFQVVSFNGVAYALPADLSQFKGVTRAGIIKENRSHGLFDGIAFYWK